MRKRNYNSQQKIVPEVSSWKQNELAEKSKALVKKRNSSSDLLLGFLLRQKKVGVKAGIFFSGCSDSCATLLVSRIRLLPSSTS